MREDIVFTVEYLVHGAMRGVYSGVDRASPRIDHGPLDPKVGKQALQVDVQVKSIRT